jgi:SAM-dependent methyltransferase
MTLEQIWERELPSEVEFWRKVLATQGLYWPWAYERGLDPEAEVLDPLLREHIDRVATDPVTILDVGAGPLTVVGKTYPGRALQITPTDVLANEYDILLAEAGIEPPIRTQQCRGEELLREFGPNRFDLAFARNSVDHAGNPLAVMRNMVAVVKPGGFVLLRHYRNEAVVGRYEELHQWNFDIRDGRLVLWNKREHHDVAAVLGDLDVSVRFEDWGDHTPWVAAAVRKPSASERSPARRSLPIPSG